jgi:hypothetical protein
VPALELRHEVVERDVDARVPVAPHRARAGVADARERVRARRREARTRRAAGGRARGERRRPRGGGPEIARESASL